MMIRFSKIFALGHGKISSRMPQSFKTSYNNNPVYRFSSNQNEKPNRDNKQDQGKKRNEISLNEIWQDMIKISQKIVFQVKKLSKFNWALLFSLPILYFLLKKQDAEEYAINYFEHQIQQNSSAFNELHIQIQISMINPIFKVFFQKDNKKFYVNYNSAERLNNILKKRHPDMKITYQYKANYQIKLNSLSIITNIISTIFIAAFFARSSSMTGGIKNNKGSGSNLYNQLLGQKKNFQIINKTNVKFADVAGLDESKVQVQQFVDFLKNPAKYQKLGARIPKGVLLSGPPGTGKTMLAKACAGQAGVPFIPTSGSDFVEIFVGVGASRVRQLFATAKQKSPSIIFIDEIDAVGRKRSGSHGSHDERDNTLNQILVQMDGFGTDHNIIVMAATNRQNLLDPALIRAGRFDRIVEVNLPDLQGRRQIFNVHLKKLVLQHSNKMDDYARRLASLTPGFSGADIANLCNQSAILAARSDKQFVTSHDFQMATQRLIGGIQKKNIVSMDQKKIVSIHQSGHAVVSWFLEGADPLLKLTIIPRSKGALGFAQYFTNQNKLNTKSQLIDQICFILGGRIAEQYFFGTCTNGAANDLQKAYKIAHNIVTKLGMNDKMGLISFRNTQYLRPYSEEMGGKIDRQIMQIILMCTQRTKLMVKKYQHLIKKLSDELYSKQTLTIKQIRQILGERQFKSHQSYQSYLQIERQSSPQIK